MSRKKAIESNSYNIGILTGKSASYNSAILKVLLKKESTSWEIAEALQNKINPTENKEARFYRKQKIYSVIQRKKSGRLVDLKSKGYILEENGKWGLTKKGLIALSVQNLDLVTKEIIAQKNTLLEKFKAKVDTIPNQIREPLGVQIDITKAKPRMARIDPLQMLVLMLEEARALISKGIDLDRISEDDLVDLIMARRSFLEKVRKLIIGE
jgi:hypothetical protein